MRLERGLALGEGNHDDAPRYNKWVCSSCEAPYEPNG